MPKELAAEHMHPTLSQLHKSHCTDIPSCFGWALHMVTTGYLQQDTQEREARAREAQLYEQGNYCRVTAAPATACVACTSCLYVLNTVICPALTSAGHLL